jgi:hypothetical protein
MRQQALHPGELVGKFGLGVPVRRIERGDQDAVDRSLNIAALPVGRIAGQARAGYDRLAVAGQDGNAVPRFLAAPGRAVAGFASCGKLSSAAFSS